MAKSALCSGKKNKNTHTHKKQEIVILFDFYSRFVRKLVKIVAQEVAVPKCICITCYLRSKHLNGANALRWGSVDIL